MKNLSNLKKRVSKKQSNESSALGNVRHERVGEELLIHIHLGDKVDDGLVGFVLVLLSFLNIFQSNIAIFVGGRTEVALDVGVGVVGAGWGHEVILPPNIGSKHSSRGLQESMNSFTSCCIPAYLCTVSVLLINVWRGATKLLLDQLPDHVALHLDVVVSLETWSLLIINIHELGGGQFNRVVSWEQAKELKITKIV